MTDDCRSVRTSVSARVDGEEAPLPAVRVDAHVAGCDDCAAFVDGLTQLTFRLDRLAAVPVLDGTRDVLARAGEQAVNGLRRPTIELRGLLGLAAAVQLVLAVLTLAGVADHLGRDLAAFELAAAGGLAAAAWRPWLAAGVLPVIAVAALAGVAVSVGDVVAGTSAVGAELAHVVLVVATWPLFELARRTSGASPLPA